jgi:hypothetical protein
MATTFETRAILGGAYKGKRASLKAMLTHAVEIDAAGSEIRVLCGRIDLDSLADCFSGDTTKAPTCPRCAKKDPRRTA